MEIFSRKTYTPRQSELAAIETPAASQPYLPNNLDITVFFGGHTDAKDFGPIKKLLSETDIFIGEFTNWTPKMIALLSRLSQGDKTARRELDALGGRFTPFAVEETRSLLGSSVRVTTIDYAAANERADEIDRHFKDWNILDEVVYSFRKTLDNIVDFAEAEADIEAYRETLMLHNIGPRLSVLIKNDPELKNRSRSRVLIHAGMYHTLFYHALRNLAERNKTVSLKRVFGQPKPIVFEHFDRLVRANVAGLSMPKDQQREIAMRALARSGLTIKAIPPVIHESDRSKGRLVLPPAEVMVERFSVDTIKQFQKKVAENNKQTD